MSLPNWAYLYGQPEATAVFKQQPEDFEVIEDFEPGPDEDGEHQWLWVEKRGANTRFVADEIARFADVNPRDIGYAGMKDRHALTRQWFSVQLPGQALLDWSALQHDEFKVLRVSRQARKLKTGTHKGNFFRIRLRSVSNMAELKQRWEKLCAGGVPNYFGAQRFGRQGQNVNEALRWFSAGKKRRVARHKQGILLSSARAWLFNQTLSQRINEQRLQAETGDVMVLTGSRSFFVADPLDDAILQRVAEGDVQLSGPLWGRGELPSTAGIRELEQQVADAEAELVSGLEQHGLKQERRPLLLMPTQPQLTVEPAITSADDEDCWLAFYLPTGCFATSIIRELITIVDKQHDEDTLE